jgi:tetratricopeptide (TPR) repeat protein
MAVCSALEGSGLSLEDPTLKKALKTAAADAARQQASVARKVAAETDRVRAELSGWRERSVYMTWRFITAKNRLQRMERTKKSADEKVNEQALATTLDKEPMEKMLWQAAEPHKVPIHQMLGTFENYDRDGSGLIQESDLRIYLSTMIGADVVSGAAGDELVTRLFQTFDIDNSKSLDLEEFTQLHGYVQCLQRGVVVLGPTGTTQAKLEQAARYGKGYRMLYTELAAHSEQLGQKLNAMTLALEKARNDATNSDPGDAEAEEDDGDVSLETLKRDIGHTCNALFTNIKGVPPKDRLDAVLDQLVVEEAKATAVTEMQRPKSDSVIISENSFETARNKYAVRIMELLPAGVANNEGQADYLSRIAQLIDEPATVGDLTPLDDAFNPLQQTTARVELIKKARAELLHRLPNPACSEGTCNCFAEKQQILIALAANTKELAERKKAYEAARQRAGNALPLYELILAKGMNELQAGNSAAALVDFNVAVALRPAAAESLKWRAAAYARMENGYDAAEADLETAVQLMGEDAELLDYSEEGHATHYSRLLQRLRVFGREGLVNELHEEYIAREQQKKHLVIDEITIRNGNTNEDEGQDIEPKMLSAVTDVRTPKIIQPVYEPDAPGMRYHPGSALDKSKIRSEGFHALCVDLNNYQPVSNMECSRMTWSAPYWHNLADNYPAVEGLAVEVLNDWFKLHDFCSKSDKKLLPALTQAFRMSRLDVEAADEVAVALANTLLQSEQYGDPSRGMFALCDKLDGVVQQFGRRTELYTLRVVTRLFSGPSPYSEVVVVLPEADEVEIYVTSQDMGIPSQEESIPGVREGVRATKMEPNGDELLFARVVEPQFARTATPWTQHTKIQGISTRLICNESAVSPTTGSGLWVFLKQRSPGGHWVLSDELYYQRERQSLVVFFGEGDHQLCRGSLGHPLLNNPPLDLAFEGSTQRQTFTEDVMLSLFNSSRSLVGPVNDQKKSVLSGTPTTGRLGEVTMALSVLLAKKNLPSGQEGLDLLYADIEEALLTLDLDVLLRGYQYKSSVPKDQAAERAFLISNFHVLCPALPVLDTKAPGTFQCDEADFLMNWRNDAVNGQDSYTDQDQEGRVRYTLEDGLLLNVPQFSLGQSIRCPDCGAVFVIPDDCAENEAFYCSNSERCPRTYLLGMCAAKELTEEEEEAEAAAEEAFVKTYRAMAIQNGTFSALTEEHGREEFKQRFVTAPVHAPDPLRCKADASYPQHRTFGEMFGDQKSYIGIEEPISFPGQSIPGGPWDDIDAAREWLDEPSVFLLTVYVMRRKLLPCRVEERLMLIERLSAVVVNSEKVIEHCEQVENAVIGMVTAPTMKLLLATLIEILNYLRAGVAEFQEEMPKQESIFGLPLDFVLSSDDNLGLSGLRAPTAEAATEARTLMQDIMDLKQISIEVPPASVLRFAIAQCQRVWKAGEIPQPDFVEHLLRDMAYVKHAAPFSDTCEDFFVCEDDLRLVNAALLVPPKSHGDRLIISVARSSSRIKMCVEDAAAAVVRTESKLHELCSFFGVTRPGCGMSPTVRRKWEATAQQAFEGVSDNETVRKLWVQRRAHGSLNRVAARSGRGKNRQSQGLAEWYHLVDSSDDRKTARASFNQKSFERYFAADSGDIAGGRFHHYGQDILEKASAFLDMVVQESNLLRMAADVQESKAAAKKKHARVLVEQKLSDIKKLQLPLSASDAEIGAAKSVTASARKMQDYVMIRRRLGLADNASADELDQATRADLKLKLGSADDAPAKRAAEHAQWVANHGRWDAAIAVAGHADQEARLCRERQAYGLPPGATAERIRGAKRELKAELGLPLEASSGELAERLQQDAAPQSPGPGAHARQRELWAAQLLERQARQAVRRQHVEDSRRRRKYGLPDDATQEQITVARKSAARRRDVNGY